MNARASILHRLADEQWARRECDRVVMPSSDEIGSTEKCILVP